ncbi:MAG: hypothetical protein Q7J64_01495 [Elusimicrobiota bacterium]|nr:hypothetical protein [Elusimicrobiota bacterium]
MSRSLRSVFFVLFLAAAVSASAGPDDYFDAGRAGALKPGQKEFLLKLENGRYALKDGRILDTRSASALTNARVAELLRGAPAGAGPGGVDPAAALGEAATRRALARLSPPKPAQMNFDGGVARSGGVLGPQGNVGAGAVGNATAADPAILQSQLLQRLVFTGKPAEKAALAESIATILKSEIGRELAAKFVAERARAEIKLATIEHSKAVVRAGKKILTGTTGMTQTHRHPPLVTISRAFLETDPEYRRLAMAGTLAHELFGHAFEEQRAKKAGLSHDAHFYYRGDEAGGRLIDWTIQTELAGKTDDGDSSKYLEDVEGYYAELVTTDQYYAITLSRAEMKNPSATLKGRRAAVAAATARNLHAMKEWRPIIEHFVKDHGVSRERLKPAEDELTAYFVWADIHAAKLVEIRKAIESRIKFWGTPEGAKKEKEIIAAADDPYLKRFEATLAARTKNLRRLLAKPAGGLIPVSDGSVMTLPTLVIRAPAEFLDLDALGVLYREDLKANPRHWKK